jgi:three-Cys-motif partner protein
MLTESTSKEDFFQYRRPWSAIKHRILSKYVDAYLRIRGGSQPEIVFLDAFAGSGGYGPDPDSQVAGSPVLVARLAQERKEKGLQNRFFAIYTEENKANYERLKRALQPFDDDLYRVFHGRFQEHISQILELMHQSPAICFLDPFGVEGISPRDIGALGERADTEFMLILHVGSLRRLAGFEDSMAPDAREKIRLVSEVLDEDPDSLSPKWLGAFRSLNTDEWEKWVVDRYISNLLKRSPDLQYACSYPVREAYNSRPKYYFIFASRAPYGVVPLNDICAAEEEELFQTIASVRRDMPTQMSLFAAPDPNAKAEDEIVRRIKGELERYPSLPRRELVLRLCYASFGEHRRKVYHKAINLMIDSQIITKGPGPIDEALLTLT